MSILGRTGRLTLVAALVGMALACLQLARIDSTTSQASAAGQTFDSHEAAIADALDKNGPIFTGWTPPRLALVFSGEMDGYLEPCGCAGLDNQKGGLKRRDTFIKDLEAKGWPVVALDMGGQIRRFGPQADRKFRFGLQALTDIGYQAIGLGIKELKLDPTYLAFVLSNFEDKPNPVTCANVTIIDASIGLSSRYRIVERAGMKIGVTAVLGKKYLTELSGNGDLQWTDPAAAIATVLPELQAANCDLLVLMVHADPDEATALGKSFPQFDFVATTGGAETPPNRLRDLNPRTDGVLPTQIVEAGHKGQYLTVVGVYDNPEQPYRLQRVPLDHRFEDSPRMQQMLVEYQNELQTVGLSGLGLDASNKAEDNFVGSAACADCHTSATEAFEQTPHAHATQTLLDLDPQRHFDPECLSCHVTGWNPQEYFPYFSGYTSLEETPHLRANGCENCHGPGAAHVAAENGETDADEAELERLRARMRLEIVENEGNRGNQVSDGAVVVTMCMQCHDEDNSPDFDFQEYWPQVEHYGMD